MIPRSLPSILLALGLLLSLPGCGLPRWPVQAEMTSPFGLRFMGTFPSAHHGVDLRVPTGTPVLAVLGGRVRFAGEMGGYGQVIWLEHARGALTVYAHLSQIQVRTGEEVRREQQIGLSGATGRVTAPHLHFEVWKGGRPVDPVQFLGRRPSPVRR
ncbi:MAG: M23 family metallopeptidase [Gemmatimonadales bacterium]|nr:MAG: M23 family metallopeptidase [Gemmatimonadales bacterium]